MKREEIEKICREVFGDECDGRIKKILDSGELIYDVTSEMARQMGELGKNLNKYLDTYGDELASVDTGFAIILTVAGKNPVDYICGTESALECMFKDKIKTVKSKGSCTERKALSFKED